MAQVLNYAEPPYTIATSDTMPTAIDLAAELVGQVLDERLMKAAARSRSLCRHAEREVDEHPF